MTVRVWGACLIFTAKFLAVRLSHARVDLPVRITGIPVNGSCPRAGGVVKQDCQGSANAEQSGVPPDHSNAVYRSISYDLGNNQLISLFQCQLCTDHAT